MHRTFVTFEADFPDDLDDDGQVMNPQGLAIATFLRAELDQASIHASEPDIEDDFAWDITCRIGRANVWILIGGAEPWLIMVHPDGLLQFLRPRSTAEAVQEVCRVIDRALKRDRRFRTVRWFTKEEFDSLDDTLGATSP